MTLTRAHVAASVAALALALAALDVLSTYTAALDARPRQLADFIAHTTRDASTMCIAFCTS